MSVKKYLDESGLKHLYSKIKESFDQAVVLDAADLGNKGSEYYALIKDAVDTSGKLVVVHDVGNGAVSVCRAKYVDDDTVSIEYVDIDDLTIVITYTSDGTVSQEVVDTVSDELKSKLDAEYDSETKKLYLTVGGTRVGSGVDCTDFIKDGMLDSVQLKYYANDGDSINEDIPYLVFTFNTDSGKEVIKVNVKDFFDAKVYSMANSAVVESEYGYIRGNTVVSGTGTEGDPWVVSLSINEEVLMVALEKLQTEETSNFMAIEALQTEDTINKENIQSNTDAIGELQQSVGANTASVAELGTKISTNTENLDALRSTVEGNTSSIGANTSAISELQQSVEDIEESISGIGALSTDEIDAALSN